jgi:LPS sulfotransferase NodH
MTPVRSYIIWFTQRVGSTLLTQALEDTGVAGRPREWLNGEHTDAATLRATLWRDGTTANGVLGVKYGMTRSLHARCTMHFSSLAGSDDKAAWDSVFPRCKHLFMTRRNRVRLAVSWWRAIQSGEWHRPTRDGTVVDAVAPRASSGLLEKYDAAALDHLVREVSLREAAIQEVFDRWHITPYTIVYEDFIARYEQTLRDVLAFLEVPSHESLAIPSPSFAPTADDIAEQWYARYCAERPLP